MQDKYLTFPIFGYFFADHFTECQLSSVTTEQHKHL